MKNLIRFTAVLGIAAALTLSGCGDGDNGTKPKPNGPSAGPAKFLVIFSQANNAEPYRAAQNGLMKKLWAEHPDVELEIHDGQQDNSKQISQIETAIRKKPDLLIVAPNERGPLTKIMGRAMEAGIPTICLERDIAEPNYTTYIRADNRKIGKQVGEFIVAHLAKKNGEPKGKIVHIQGLLGVEGETNRHEGAQEVIDEHPGIEVVQSAVAGWIQSNARDRMTEILNVQPEIDVVYGHNDPMAVGAYLAAKAKGRESQMIFIGVDGLGGPAGGIKKVQDGVLAVTFTYPLCVDKAVEIGNRILREADFKPEKTYTMESEIVTPDNAAEMYKKNTVE